MNRFKFEAFKTEFPALNELLLDRDSRHCDSIAVRRMDREFLNTIPTFNSWEGSMVGIKMKETISFILADGTVIQDAVRQRGEHGSNYAHHETEVTAGESILEAIDRHQVAETLQLIVIVRSGFTVRAHYSEPDFEVAIYKMAKGEVLTKLIERAASAALEQVRAEANF